LDGLSLLKIPTILPKKPFFFCGSSLSAVLSGLPGGGRAFCVPSPNMREKKPPALAVWSQVALGSVPAMNAAL
jgi:hypothetical protein